MHSTMRSYGDRPVARVLLGLLFLGALGIGLMQVTVKGLERVEPPQEVKMPAPVTGEDVLSAADARQWRQEFLWHRSVRKSCFNPWIDGDLCTRSAQQL